MSNHTVRGKLRLYGYPKVASRSACVVFKHRIMRYGHPSSLPSVAVLRERINQSAPSNTLLVFAGGGQRASVDMARFGAMHKLLMQMPSDVER